MSLAGFVLTLKGEQMRTIKFRAWNTISNKMVSHEEIINDFILYEELCRPLERNVFMQWTGVRTTEGVEIYEGDIISLPSYPNKGTNIYVVEYYGGAFHVSDFRSTLDKYDDYEGDYGYHHGELVSEHRFELEIVGNIYQNKDLL